MFHIHKFRSFRSDLQLHNLGVNASDSESRIMSRLSLRVTLFNPTFCEQNESDGGTNSVCRFGTIVCAKFPRQWIHQTTIAPICTRYVVIKRRFCSHEFISTAAKSAIPQTMGCDRGRYTVVPCDQSRCFLSNPFSSLFLFTAD